MIESYCGLLCSTCSYKETHNCPGCLAAHGDLFHGTCKMAKCCESRSLPHCGKCPDFPCRLLADLAADPVHGEGGRFLDRLREWAVTEE